MVLAVGHLRSVGLVVGMCSVRFSLYYILLCCFSSSFCECDTYSKYTYNILDIYSNICWKFCCQQMLLVIYINTSTSVYCTFYYNPLHSGGKLFGPFIQWNRAVSYLSLACHWDGDSSWRNILERLTYNGNLLRIVRHSV